VLLLGCARRGGTIWERWARFKVCAIRLLARLGEWSYALYLTHLFVITFYIKHFISTVYEFDVPWPVHYIVMTASCIAVAAGFHVMVERPLSRWTLRKLSPRREVSDVEPRLSGQSAP
jgi:peptidoglycan/LPS O-acetylase OafA/YrhL